MWLTLYHTILTFNDPESEALENIVGKRENAGNQQFSFSNNVFCPFNDNSFISATPNLSFALALNLDIHKIVSFRKKFTPYHTILDLTLYLIFQF